MNGNLLQETKLFFRQSDEKEGCTVIHSLLQQQKKKRRNDNSFKKAFGSSNSVG